MRGDCICRLLCARVRPPEQNALLTVADPGKGHSPLPLYFQTKLRTEGPKKFLLRPAPPLVSRSESSTGLYGKNCPLGLNGQPVILRCLYSQGGGGTPYNGPFGQALPERGTFSRPQVYERVGIYLVEVYKSVFLSVKRPVSANRRIYGCEKVENISWLCDIFLF